jgi:hypothetical protein
VARALQRAHVVAVRDEASQALCRGLGAESRIVPDHAWALSLPDSGSGERLGVSLRRWPGLDVRAVAAGMQAGGPWQGPALFLPMEAPDLEVGRELQALLGAERIEVPDRLPTLPDLISDLARCRAVVAMRLHAGLLAAALGIPSVGIAYDPKVSELHRALGGISVPVAEAGHAPLLLASEMEKRGAGWPSSLQTFAGAQREAARAAARELLGELRPHG